MCVLMCNFVSYFVCVILCIFVFLCDILLPSGVINDDDDDNSVHQLTYYINKFNCKLSRPYSLIRNRTKIHDGLS